METGTLIKGLNEAMVKAKVDAIDSRPFLYARHFPLVEIDFFEWKTLMSQGGPQNVAADVAADNASIIRKSRPIFQTASGDIPLLNISREKFRTDIKKYQVALALAKDPNATKLVRYWAEDVEFCFRGIQFELEYIAWALASNAGKLAFTSSNNAAVATEFDLDYEVPSTQKKVASVPFSDAANADFFKVVAEAVEAGDAIGADIKYLFLNNKEVAKIARQKKVIAACASFGNNALNIAQTPSLEMINSALLRNEETNGVQIIPIKQKVSRELANGQYTTANPFADNRLLFSETSTLGSTQYSLLDANEDSPALRVQRAHTVVKKYGVTEPYKEVTLAEADALPVFDSAYKNIYYRTDETNW